MTDERRCEIWRGGTTYEEVEDAISRSKNDVPWYAVKPKQGEQDE
jgi:hypothetical protein